MSGIALIIPGADFSNSPLGTVNFKKSIKDKVDQYAQSIGSEDYNVALTAMLRSLQEIGLEESLDIYPILGDTLAKAQINLNARASVAETEWYGRNLINVSGSSLQYDGGMPFINATGGTAASNHDIDVNLSDTPYIFGLLSSPASGNIYYTNRSSTEILLGLSGRNPRLVAEPVDFVFSNEITLSVPEFYSVSITEDSQLLTVGSTSKTKAGTKSKTTIPFTDVIGAKQSGATSFYFFAKGLVPSAKVSSVDAILKEFCYAIGKKERPV